MNNLDLIIGNLCTLLAMGGNAISSTRKTAKGVLMMQTLSQGIYCVSGIVLKGYSASAQNAVSILRNIVAIRNINSKAIQWILTGLALVFGIAFNNRGLMGLLPVVGNLQYTLAIFRFPDNERAVKLSFLLSSICYAVFNIVIQNYVGIAADSFVVVATAIVLLKGLEKTENEK